VWHHLPKITSAARQLTLSTLKKSSGGTGASIFPNLYSLPRACYSDSRLSPRPRERAWLVARGRGAAAAAAPCRAAAATTAEGRGAAGEEAGPGRKGGGARGSRRGDRARAGVAVRCSWQMGAGCARRRRGDRGNRRGSIEKKIRRVDNIISGRRIIPWKNYSPQLKNRGRVAVKIEL
jgi:hypothetical protein